MPLDRIWRKEIENWKEIRGEKEKKQGAVMDARTKREELSY